MPRTTERFWGHPDDWPDDEWEEYVAERRARAAAPPEPVKSAEDNIQVLRRSYSTLLDQEGNRYIDTGLEDEFDELIAVIQTDAYFRGAESMCDQTAEDHFDGANVPQFVSLYEEDVEYEDWQKRNG